MSAKSTAPGPRGASVLGDIYRLCGREISRIDGARWPMVRYQKDPVAFVREQIGEQPMRHQRRIMRDVARSMRAKVAVRSGQKTGKTKLAIWLALWFYCSFPEARVFLTADTAPQIKRVLWPELNKTLAVARRKRGLLIETPAKNPETGMLAPDGRMILGFTTRTIEAMAGLSGQNMLFVGDEASALEKPMFDAIRGNTAGGARMLLISNPTRAEGPFFDVFGGNAHPRKRKGWSLHHLSSEALAIELAAKGKSVPGVATLATIKEWEEDDGRESVFFIMRALGNFSLDEAAKIVSLHLLLAAQQRWEDAENHTGPLSIGCDPAGDSGEGDEFAFSVVRGAKQLHQEVHLGLSEDAALSRVKELVATFREGDEIPRVIIDAEGPIGSAFYGRCRGEANHLQIHSLRESCEVWGVKSSQDAVREPQLYARIRDELWASLGKWMRTGAVITDRKLEQELHCPGYSVTVKGKRVATDKKIMKEKLGRSPDRADALALAVWEPCGWLVPDTKPVLEMPPERLGVTEKPQQIHDSGPMNPYGDFGRSSGRFDPYR